MSWVNIVLPIVTGVVGIAIGFFGGVQYLKKQMTNMSFDDHQLREMAKKMGYNLNQKQLKQIKSMQNKMKK
ncbi:YneF family protein [Microaerobacter geothermalis]|uniref:YneF family protein n=1 Tax=Microaerobacter geothermalis TaxID=674972 RepID=UPI001F408E1E|nr:YneF family protein [Microaerobacter geothermalis]MCF6094125.1 YneF family protein [Microaerobacter geothermalis]